MPDLFGHFGLGTIFGVQYPGMCYYPDNLTIVNLGTF